ncbi:MAG: FTR1 family protein [Rhodospirillaceae bacterium]
MENTISSGCVRQADRHALIIVYREVLEAGLIIGIVLAATVGIPGRSSRVFLGVAGGVAGACVVALFADVVSAQFAGSGQELFNAVVLLAAVVMLGWHNVWMAAHARALTAEMQAVGRAVAGGAQPLRALTVVVGIAVLREGSEVVLFLAGTGTVAGAGSPVAGGLAGIGAGVLTALLIYKGLLSIPPRYLFAVTGWLITLLAAGMASQAVAFLHQADVITIGAGTVWDSSGLLRDDGLPGRILHVLIGYSDRPTAAQIAAYLIVITGIFMLTRHVRNQNATIP